METREWRPEKRDLNAIGKHEICRGLLSRAEDSPLPALVTPNKHRSVFFWVKTISSRKVLTLTFTTDGPAPPPHLAGLTLILTLILPCIFH